MRKVNLNQGLAMKLTPELRESIERIAEQKEISLGEAARMLIDAGLAKYQN